MFLDHNDAAQSVGLLWTSDQLVAETSTWQHTTLTTDKYPCPGGIRTKDLRRRAACGRLPAEIFGSNPTRGMDICLLWVSCVVRYRSLRRADHSSRGVLPTVLRHCDLETSRMGAPYIYDISTLSVKHYIKMTQGRVNVELHVFLTSVPDGSV